MSEPEAHDTVNLSTHPNAPTASPARASNAVVTATDPNPPAESRAAVTASAQSHPALQIHHQAQQEFARFILQSSTAPAGNLAADAVRWACSQLATGASPRALCAAVLDVAAEIQSGSTRLAGLKNNPRTTAALVTAVSAAIQLSERQENSIRPGAATDSEAAVIAAVLVVASAAEALQPAANSPIEKAPQLTPSSSPLADFWLATSSGRPAQAMRSWLQLAEVDSIEARDALNSAATLRFSAEEQFLIVPAALALASPATHTHHQLLCCVVGQISCVEVDEEFATDFRMQAQILAEDALDRSPETHGRFERATHERMTALATGIARTPPERLPLLLLASLEDGLTPEDLVDTLALLRAAAYSITSSRDTSEQDSLAALTACIAADAVQLCMTRTTSLSLRYELALAAPSSPSATQLSNLAELCVPPSDSGGLADMLLAVAEGDPESASDAAAAIPPEDHASTDTAWCALRRAVAGDYSMQMQRLVHVTALERGFRNTDHPAKIWFLAAAARSAAQARSQPHPLATLATDILS